jgi:4'-phosphopantetheinyl transferase
MPDRRTATRAVARRRGYPSDVLQWLARGEGGVPPGRDWLTPTEARRAASMRFAKRRNEYLVRRFAGKCAVAASAGLTEEPATLSRIGVLNAPTGAPYVEVDGQPLGLDISLTDRAGWAVGLVGPDLAAVGCDLEIVEPRSPGFVRDFLTTAEQAQVAAAAAGGGPDGHDALANLIWSAKESALKVMRTGLRADTRTVEVSLDDPTAPGAAGGRGPVGSAREGGSGAPSGRWQRLTVATPLGDLPGWWRRDGVFLLTVVADAGPGPSGDPPRELAGSSPLADAVPVHSWMASPLAD